MFSAHPLDPLPTATLKKLLIALLLLTVGLSVLIAMWGASLVHDGATLGIVSFEFVWNLQGLERVMGPWGDIGRRTALHINLIDFIYMASYSTTLATAALLIRKKAFQLQLGQLAKVALVVAWFAWIAAGFDAIENLASLPLLLGTPAMPWPLVMSVAAAIKFLLLLEVILFIVFITFFLVVLARKGRLKLPPLRLP